MNIKKTKDYDKFHFMCGNRGIDPRALNSLKIGIQSNNLLYCNPILVSKEYGVIDGQHRLEAAKALNIEVYFICINKTDEESTGLLAKIQFKKQWGMVDFLKFYITTDKSKKYHLIIEFAKRIDVNPQTILQTLLIFSKYRSSGISEFRNLLRTGKLDVENIFWDKVLDFEKKYILYRDFLSFRKIRPLSIFKSMAGIAGFAYFIDRYDIDFEDFMKKLESQWYMLRSHRGLLSQNNNLVDIYNYRRHSKLEKTRSKHFSKIERLQRDGTVEY